MRRLGLVPLVLLACTPGSGRNTTFISGADEVETSGESDEVGTSGPETGTSESTSEASSESESDTTDTSADESTSETGGGVCERQRYTFNLANSTWTAIPIEQDWTGTFAPPCSVGVLAATYVPEWSELIVVGDDEQIWRRIDGVWQPPQPWATDFAALVGAQPTAMVHVPNADDPGETTLYFLLASGEAVIYGYTQAGTATLIEVVMQEDGVPPAAPQASEDLRWGFTLADVALIGQADWLVWTLNYTDGYLYTFNAAFEWTQQVETNNQYFGTGQPDEPNPSTIEAAYADFALGRAYFIGP